MLQTYRQTRHIYYRRLPLWKYELTEAYHVHLPDLVDADGKSPLGFIHQYFHFFPQTHVLSICNGYRWDGASGPTVDTLDTMRASLVHDALYQAMREDLLSHEFRKAADDVLWRLLREDGMHWFRAYYWYRAVRRFAGCAAERDKKQDLVYTAPLV